MVRPPAGEEPLEVVVAALALARAAFRAFPGAGLTLPQTVALWWLTRFPGCTAGQLAEDLGMEPSRISAVVHALLRSGRVAKVPDPRDRRRAFLRITVRGREALRGARAALHQRLSGAVLQGFTSALALAGALR